MSEQTDLMIAETDRQLEETLDFLAAQNVARFRAELPDWCNDELPDWCAMSDCQKKKRVGSSQRPSHAGLVPPLPHFSSTQHETTLK